MSSGQTETNHNDKMETKSTSEDNAVLSELKGANSMDTESGDKNHIKRTPTKRLSFIERAQKESEELVRTMGGSLELEGGRRTRSSMRASGTAISTPPPAKKNRNASESTPRSRARKGAVNKSLDMKTLNESENKATEESSTPSKKSEVSESVADVENNKQTTTTLCEKDIPPEEDSKSKNHMEAETATEVLEPESDNKEKLENCNEKEEQSSKDEQVEEATTKDAVDADSSTLSKEASEIVTTSNNGHDLKTDENNTEHLEQSTKSETTESKPEAVLENVAPADEASKSKLLPEEAIVTSEVINAEGEEALH